MNISIPALRPDVIDHHRYRDFLMSAIDAEELLGSCELVLSGVVRILTNPRVFQKPSSTIDVLRAIELIRSAPRTQSVRPGERHWAIFTELCMASRPRGTWWQMHIMLPWQLSMERYLSPMIVTLPPSGG